MISNNAKIGILITGIILTSIFQGVIIPILDMKYESIYFILFVSSAEFCIIFGMVFLMICLYNKKIPTVKEKKSILLGGLFNALMAVCLLYASDPERTPVVIQSILSGLSIIPSVIMTKYILKKNLVYNYWFCIPGIILLLASVGIASIPLYSHWNIMAVVWVLVYIAGTVFRSAFNIMQEKYFMDTEDFTLANRIANVFYTRLVQFAFVCSLFWLEFIFGYATSPITMFKESFETFIHNWLLSLLLEAFVVSYLVAYVLAVYLNSISTNYNMITSTAVTPGITLFFTIFRNLNPGFQYPLYILLPSLFCSVASIILWVKGEKKSEYTPIGDKDSVN